MKFREGEDVVIMRSAYKCSDCGGHHGEYYYDGSLEEVKLQSQGRIVKIDSEYKLLLRLKNGKDWWVHPDEIDFLDKTQIAKLSRLLPGMNDLPRHPVFEISEQTPVFLFNDKVYSLGNGDSQEEENFYEQNKKQGAIKRLFSGEKITKTRTPLIEVGDFNSLEALMLDRAQPDLERIEESYVKEVQKELDSFRLDGNLDIPQLIFKQVFPYLQNEHYTKKVSELLGFEGKKDVTPNIQKVKITKELEKIIDETETEIKNLISKIEENEPVIRTKKQSKLDDLFNYEDKSNNKDSLLGKALNRRNIAIVNGNVYDLVDGNGYEESIQINGQRFSLVEREEEKLISSELKKGAKVRIIKDSEYYHQNKGVGVIIEEFGSRDKGWAAVNFEDGYSNKYREIDLEVIEKKSEKVKTSPKDIENRFLDEFGKKIRVDALKKHLSRDKIIDLLRTQDAELLGIAGKKEYKGNGFGFTQDKRGNYYAYLEVPAFAIKSQYDRNYYLFDKSRVGIRVWREGKRINYNGSLIAIDNNNHPFLHNKKGDFTSFCAGGLDFPTSGRDNGEVIAKRLRRCREMLMFGYTSGAYNYSYRLDKENKYFDKNRIGLEELEKLGVPIIQGGER